MKGIITYFKIFLFSYFFAFNITTASYAASTFVNASKHHGPIRNETTHERIIIIRHAEKPPLGMGQLTCKGFNRALALTHLLAKKYGNPDFLFAPNPTAFVYEPVPYFYVRPLVTLQPFSIYFNANINTQFGFSKIRDLTQELMQSKYHNATIFIAWEHLAIVKLAKEIVEHFGGQPEIIPRWPRNDYDSIYFLDIDWETKKIKFFHESENLNNQDASCPQFRNIEPKNTSYEQTLFFIPVAETQNDKLSCTGFNRALALQKLLAADNKHIKKEIDIFLTANTRYSLENNMKNFKYTAGIMTLEPTAINQMKPLMCPYNLTESNRVIGYLQQKRFQTVTIAIALPMHLLQYVATNLYQQLGGNVNDLPNAYPNINTIYRFDVVRDATGKVKTLRYRAFSENIMPKSNCDF